jgi:serine protease Do
VNEAKADVQVQRARPRQRRHEAKLRKYNRDGFAKENPAPDRSLYYSQHCDSVNSYNYKPFVAKTCETTEHDAIPIEPGGSESLDLFSIHDPFGLRRAVVPLLLKDFDNTIRGMGTAFHVDGWGTFLTAYHVIEAVRMHSKASNTNENEQTFTFSPSDVYPILLLGIGVVYGQVRVPEKALSLVGNIFTTARERNDPLAILSGRKEFENASDVAVMRPSASIPESMTGTLALRFSGWQPKKGDTVLALGYPELKCEPLDEVQLQYLLSDGMSAAYGHIIAIHPNGRGNDPTPVIEVQANWPSGMSGGPVFNDQGEVVGIVLRSFLPNEEAAGNGCAACIQLIPWLRERISTLDPANPGWRLGWAVLKKDTGELSGFYKGKEHALENQSILGADYEVRYASNRIGTDDVCVNL